MAKTDSDEPEPDTEAEAEPEVELEMEPDDGDDADKASPLDKLCDHMGAGCAFLDSMAYCAEQIKAIDGGEDADPVERHRLLAAIYVEMRLTLRHIGRAFRSFERE